MWTLIWWKRGEYYLTNFNHNKAKRKYYKHFHNPIKRRGLYNYMEFRGKPRFSISPELKGEWEIYRYGSKE